MFLDGNAKHGRNQEFEKNARSQSKPAISRKRDGRESAKAILHAEFVTLPCGHAPFAEIPEVFLESVFQFLCR